MVPQVFLIGAEFMNSLSFPNKQKKKLLILLLIVFVSIFSVYTPYNVLDNDEHNNDFGSLFKYFINIPAAKFNRLRSQARNLLCKIFKWLLIHPNTAVLVVIRSFLFNTRFSNKYTPCLFYLICFYFNGGKFKDIHHYRLVIKCMN